MLNICSYLLSTNMIIKEENLVVGENKKKSKYHGVLSILYKGTSDNCIFWPGHQGGNLYSLFMYHEYIRAPVIYIIFFE